MGKHRTHYEILQVSPFADPEIIQSAYKTLMATLKKHPDLGGNEDEAKRINEAYAILANPVTRAIYDQGLHRYEANESVRKAESERRRVPRTHIETNVSYCISHNNLWNTARVKDFSTLGLRIQSHSQIAKGEHLVIATANTASVAIHGTVKWIRMFHPTLFQRVYEAGIEFSDQITDIEQRLKV